MVMTRAGRITLRSILTGSLLLALQAAATPYNNFYVAATHIAGNHFPIGVKWYRKMRPLFLGAVLGECCIGGVWILVGIIVGTGYRVLPG